MRRMIFAAAGLSGLFAASSTSEAHAFGYTLTDINVLGSQPDSTDGVGLNDSAAGSSTLLILRRA